MKQICLLVAMSIMSSVNGDTCESLWAEVLAEQAAGRHVDVVRRQEPIACGHRPAFTDVENGAFPDDSVILNKILGGSFARRGEIPWQVNIYTLFTDPQHACGGAILNDFWVLTAAECVYNVRSVLQVKVVLGNYMITELTGLREDILINGSSTRPYPVEKVFIHHLYDAGQRYDYNIALIKVCSNRIINFNNETQPICLPEPGKVLPTGTELTFSGWGRDNPRNDEIPFILKKVILPVINHTVCSEEVYPGLISDRMLCAGEVNGNTDDCHGEKGGPAVYKSGDVYVLAGIMVGGTGCELPSYPVIFSSVSAYRTWIDDVINRDDNLGEIEIYRI